MTDLTQPQAWMTEDGRVVSDHTKRTAMASTSKPAFCIPLYASPVSIPQDGTRVRVTDDMVEAACQRLYGNWLGAGTGPLWRDQRRAAMRAALIAALERGELAYLMSEVDQGNAIVDRRCAEAEGERDALRAKLERYGSHSKGCSRPRGPECDCGWDDELRAIRARTQGGGE